MTGAERAADVTDALQRAGFTASQGTGTKAHQVVVRGACVRDVTRCLHQLYSACTAFDAVQLSRYYVVLTFSQES